MKPALSRAINYLEKSIADLKKKRQHRLAPLTKLAASADVCHVTMIAAVRMLRERGLLTVSHRHGIRITDNSGVQESDSGFSSSSANINLEISRARQRVLQAIRGEFLTGHYPSGATLPVIKTLCERYGTSHVTIRRALKSLEREGDIQRHGRGYRRPSGCPPMSPATIILVMRGVNEYVPQLTPPRVQTEFLLLEEECRRQNINLKIVLFYYIEQQMLGLDRLAEVLGETTGNKIYVGCIVWTAGINQTILISACNMIASTAIPTAIFDDSGSPLPSLPRSPGKVFHLGGSPLAGRIMAEYLVAFGHRFIACIHPVEQQGWSFNRFSGIRQVYGRYADKTRVTVLVPDDSNDEHRSAAKFHARLQTLRLNLLRLSRPRNRRDRNDSAMRLFGELVPFLEHIDERMILRMRLFPVFTRLVRDRSITAWIGANDAVAAAAIDFLREQDIDVPGRISIVGFDDGHEALHNAITSYNFNVSAYMQEIIRYLLTARLHHPTADKSVEIPGYVKIRHSSAPSAEKNSPE